MLGHRAAGSQPAPARGAYGFTLIGAETLPEGLVTAGPDWPRLQLLRERSDPDAERRAPGTMCVTETGAEVWLAGHDRIHVDRASLTARLKTDEPLSDEAMIHPYLALAAAFAASWLGRWVLHGGAFSHAGHAWGLLGDKGAGKSSTLAALLHAGRSVLSDDLLVVEGLRLFCGPRCIDLRREAAEMLGGTPIGVAGDRRRWRLRPGDVAPSMDLGGLVYLEWGESLRVEPLSPEERLDGVIRNSFSPPAPGQELGLLELAGLPAWRLVRPQRLEALEPATAHLLHALG